MKKNEKEVEDREQGEKQKWGEGRRGWRRWRGRRKIRSGRIKRWRGRGREETSPDVQHWCPCGFQLHWSEKKKCFISNIESVEDDKDVSTCPTLRRLQEHDWEPQELGQKIRRQQIHELIQSMFVVCLLPKPEKKKKKRVHVNAGVKAEFSSPSIHPSLLLHTLLQFINVLHSLQTNKRIIEKL